jgi:ankyrin repeat protein
MLEREGVKPDSYDNHHQTSLSLASENGHEAVVRLLLEGYDVDLNSEDIWGRTPLLHAASEGHEAVVRLLLEQGSIDVTWCSEVKVKSDQGPRNKSMR